MEKKGQTSILIPKSRFREFDDTWQRTRAEDAFSIFNGYAFSSNDAQGEGCRWIKIADVGILRMRSENKAFLPQEFATKHKKFLLEEGDYVVALTRPILNGELKIAQIDKAHSNSLLNQRVGKLVTENVPSFIYFILQRRELVFQIDVRIAGTDPPNLAPSEIASLPVFIPTLLEQRKIADFLTAVDGRIGQLIQKKALLTDYKKGVMQQLFTQAIRFKDDHGNDFPDWEEKKLGEVGTAYGGLSGKSGENFGSGKPFVTYKQIFDQSTIDLQKCGNVEIKPTESQNRVKKGDILFTTSSETRLEVGYTSVVMDDVAELYLNSFCFGFRMENKNELSPEFARYLFHSNDARRSITVLGQGSTRYNISKNKLMKQSFLIPSLPEQTKIADFLSTIDRKIEGVTTQITETQTFKRGLLQQMFV